MKTILLANLALRNSLQGKLAIMSMVCLNTELWIYPSFENVILGKKLMIKNIIRERKGLIFDFVQLWNTVTKTGFLKEILGGI